MPKILIVEEDDTQRDCLRCALEAAGYEVICANSSVEALCKWGEAGRALDGLLAQVTMYPIGGLNLAETIRAHIPSLRVLFLVGSKDELPLIISMREAAVIEKPFLLADVVRALTVLFHSREGLAV